MADSRIVSMLDEKLMSEGIIDRQYSADYAKVHAMLNSKIRKTGAVLAEKVFIQGDAKLRKWLMSLYKLGASQDKLTSYLRCGLAHLSFDFIESSYKSIDNNDLITRVLRSFKNRDFHKSFFRAAETSKPVKKKRPVKKKKVKAVKKKKIVKKAKKKLVKKVKKTPVKKKTARKSVKKKTVKNNRKAKKKSKIKKSVKRKKKTLFVRLFR